MLFRGMFRLFCGVMVIVMVCTFSSGCCAQTTVKDNNVEDVPGLWFENIIYSWNKVVLDIVNTTSENVMFGGTMVFLDRRGKQIAKANLLPKRIASLKTERYTAFFIEGSGETARRAARVIWDFGTL